MPKLESERATRKGDENSKTERLTRSSEFGPVGIMAVRRIVFKEASCVFSYVDICAWTLILLSHVYQVNNQMVAGGGEIKSGKCALRSKNGKKKSSSPAKQC